MHCESLYIVFNAQGHFVGVERGNAMDYDLT